MTAVINILISLSITITPVTAQITSYAPLDNQSGICADENPTLTSKGFYPQLKIIAVDPRKLAYGTLVYIPGHGHAIAGDTGGALRNYDGIAIDVFRDTSKESREWGKKHMTVYVYDWRVE